MSRCARRGGRELVNRSGAPALGWPLEEKSLTAKKGSLTSQLTLALSSWRRCLDMRNSHLSVKLFNQTGKKLVYLTPKLDYS